MSWQDSRSKQVAILILFFNRFDETIQCIESFLPSDQNIYVLNNGSDPALWDRLKTRYRHNKKLNFFHSECNLGVSAGRNFLIRQSAEPWILIVDNDITVSHESEWFDKFNYLSDNNPGVDIFALHIFNVHENDYVRPIRVSKNGKVVTIETTEDTVTNCFPGTGTIIHRSIFEKHGLFDESLFVGFEDYEFALRSMTSPGEELSVLHVKEIELIHDHKYQKKLADKNAVRERYSERRIRESYDRIISKYDIELDHDWQWWTRKQVADMTESFFSKLVRKMRHLKKFY